MGAPWFKIWHLTESDGLVALSKNCRAFRGVRQRYGSGCGNYYKNDSKVPLVPGAGIEPARLSAGDFESPASTNFTTRAERNKSEIMAQCGV